METEATNDDIPTTDGDTLVDDELLIEEISIDGMCGVY
jgi:mycofactocin precursor